MPSSNNYMVKRSKMRRVMKWMGLVVCVLIFAIWVASGLWVFEYRTPYGETVKNIEFTSGCCNYLTYSLQKKHYNEALLDNPIFVGEELRSRFTFRKSGNNLFYILIESFELPAKYSLSFLRREIHFDGYLYYIPLWLPFVFFAIPTAILWHRDRKSIIPSGHCQNCGYNLFGNVSGICPECETEVPHKKKIETT